MGIEMSGVENPVSIAIPFFLIINVAYLPSGLRSLSSGRG